MTKIRDTKQNKYWILIVILITCHAVCNYFWIKQDSESLGKDVCNHINITVSLHQELKEILFQKAAPIEKGKEIYRLFIAKDISPFINWPVLVHSIAAFIGLVFCDILFCIRFSNIIYFAILIICVYLIGKKICSPEAGIISAYLISFYPGVFGLSRKFGLDFPLMAIICLIIYFLLCSDEFQNRLYSVLFGITLGVGMLIKAQCFFFIVGPFLYVIIKRVRNKQHKLDYILNVKIAVILAIAFASTWWYRIFQDLGHFKQIIWINFFHRLSTSKFQNGTILEEATYYLKAMAASISPVFFVMFLIGLFLYARKLGKKNFGSILLWFCVPYLIFSLIPMKESVYIFPVFGAVALLSVVGLLQSNFRRNAKLIFILLFVCFAGYQFFEVSFIKNSDFINPGLSHPPQVNNHQSTMENFSKIIQEASTKNKNIIIIEEKYFRADVCVRLKYFLKIMDKENIARLSASGAFPTEVNDELLSHRNRYEFLIAFSRSNSEPDFLGMSMFSNEYTKKPAKEAIKDFKEYEILERDVLFPERINIFLLHNLRL